ncbi:MAG: DUF5134 domain-containing protein [Caldilineaceae bacterium]
MIDGHKLYNVLLWITFYLSSYVLVSYLLRLFLHESIQQFDVVSDWFGHGAHGIGMSYMALLMLGKIANLISNHAWSTFFGLCTLAFAVRLVTGNFIKAWWEWVHLAMGVSMVYMFWNTSQWLPVLTGIFCLGCLTLILYYSKEAFAGWEVSASKQRLTTFLSNSAHIAIGVAMIAMFVTMQWPQLFGIQGGCMHGMAMPACPFGR